MLQNVLVGASRTLLLRADFLVGHFFYTALIMKACHQKPSPE